MGKEGCFGVGEGAAKLVVRVTVVLSSGFSGIVNVEGVNTGAVAESEEPKEGALNDVVVNVKGEDSLLTPGVGAASVGMENVDEEGSVA